MRKILLASSALVGVAMLAAPAFAGDLTVKLSGYDDAMLGFNTETATTSSTSAGADVKSNNVGMENLFDINVSVEGKGSNNLDYGAMISLWNGPSYSNGWSPSATSATAVTEQQAYVWMSNNWGKVMMGDAHGATDLFVYAPTVGSNQIDGYYQQFLNLARDWRALPTFIDNDESSTRVTYYTPKVSGFQGGISYTPNLYTQGMTNSSVVGPVGTAATVSNLYDNQVEAAIGWSGSYDKANFKVTGLATTAEANDDVASAVGAHAFAQDYLSLGLGGQVGFAGFTVGASYSNAGHYDALAGQDKPQDMWTLGAKYDWGQAAFAINGELGEGYDISWAGLAPGATLGESKAGDVIDTDYIRQYDAIGFGATYTWFPGLVSGVDVVLFNQEGEYSNVSDSGAVAILSQRVNF
jgi:outer membrane protein OmpU